MNSKDNKTDGRLWAVIRFKEIDSNTIKVTLNPMCWLASEKWDENYAYFDRAWGIVLESLEQSFGLE